MRARRHGPTPRALSPEVPTRRAWSAWLTLDKIRVYELRHWQSAQARNRMPASDANRSRTPLRSEARWHVSSLDSARVTLQGLSAPVVVAAVEKRDGEDLGGGALIVVAPTERRREDRPLAGRVSNKCPAALGKCEGATLPAGDAKRPRCGPHNLEFGYVSFAARWLVLIPPTEPVDRLAHERRWQVVGRGQVDAIGAPLG